MNQLKSLCIVFLLVACKSGSDSKTSAPEVAEKSTGASEKPATPVAGEPQAPALAAELPPATAATKNTVSDLPANVVKLKNGASVRHDWDDGKAAQPVLWDVNGTQVVFRANCDVDSGEGEVIASVGGVKERVFVFPCNPAHSGGWSFLDNDEGIHFVVTESGSGAEPGTITAARLVLQGNAVKVASKANLSETDLDEGACYSDQDCDPQAYCMHMGPELDGYCHGNEDASEE